MLQKLQAEIQTMKEKDMQRILGQKEQMEEIYFGQGEVQNLQEIMQQLITDISNQTAENSQEKQKLEEMFNKYEVLQAEYNSAKEQNDRLKQQTAQLEGQTGKGPVTQALGQKASAADQASKGLEKSFINGGGDVSSFLGDYMKQRREFHKYSMLKVKVAQC